MAQTRLRKRRTGAFVEVGGADDAGVTFVRWVDPQTTLAPEDQTGSAIAPFSTLAAALTSLQTSPTGREGIVGTIICADGDYEEQGLSWVVGAEGDTLELQGFGNARNLGLISVSGESFDLFLTQLGNQSSRFSLESSVSGSVWLRNCYLNTITGEVAIDVETCSVLGAVAADRIENVSDSEFLDAVVLSGGVDAANTAFQGALTAEQNVNLADCVCAALVDTSAASSHVARDTVFQRGLVYSTLEATDCTFTGQEGDTLEGGSATLQGGICNLPIDSTTDLFLYDVVFGGVGEQAANIAADNATINGCLLNGNLTLGGNLEIDSTSYQQVLDGFVVSVTGTRTLSNPPLSITLEIVVPAVAADAVGYVDTTLVGTELEGFFQEGQAVLVNPQSDLVAAGAGGAFVNARISAANTLRTAFRGALAGGAANFTVTRVS